MDGIAALGLLTRVFKGGWTVRTAHTETSAAVGLIKEVDRHTPPIPDILVPFQSAFQLDLCNPSIAMLLESNSEMGNHSIVVASSPDAEHQSQAEVAKPTLEGVTPSASDFASTTAADSERPVYDLSTANGINAGLLASLMVDQSQDYTTGIGVSPGASSDKGFGAPYSWASEAADEQSNAQW